MWRKVDIYFDIQKNPQRFWYKITQIIILKIFLPFVNIFLKKYQLKY